MFQLSYNLRTVVTGPDGSINRSKSRACKTTCHLYGLPLGAVPQYQGVVFFAQVEPEAAHGVMIVGGVGTDPVVLSASEVGNHEAARCWLQDILVELPSGSSSRVFTQKEAARHAAEPNMVSKQHFILKRKPYSTRWCTAGMSLRSQALLLRDLRLSGESTVTAFTRIDTNGDGLVSHAELCAAGVPETLAHAMMERGDATGDGLLDLQEMRCLALVDDESAQRVAIHGTPRAATL